MTFNKATIWYEKYRPSTMEEILLPRTMKTALNKHIKSGEIPHLLFYSTSPGVGKTSLAQIICTALETDYLYINASVYDSVDLLRNTVERFADTMSMSGKPKVVILDEFGSGSSKKFQEGLKAFIETYVGNCRFIFTSNSSSSILDYIKSRCTAYCFDFKDSKTKTEMLKKVFLKIQAVLKKESVEIEDKLLLKVIQKHFPDMRKIYNNIQKYVDGYGSIIGEDILEFNPDDVLLDLIMNKDLRKVRENIINGGYSYPELYRYLYDKLVPRFTEKNKQCVCICIISEFMWRESQGVNDSEINFMHCIIKLMELV